MKPLSTDADRGRQAAQELWDRGLDASDIEDPLTPEFARVALAELERLQEGTAGVLREALEGAQMSAEQLNVESFHGLIEIVQNADDLHAREVRVAVRKTRGQSRLLVAHNGDRVELRHVIAMTFAFVSTKRSDPRAKGRFGIGLKTLGRLGDCLTVHCTPYHFTIEGHHVRIARAKRSIAGLYDSGSTDTLLELQLRPGFDSEDFANWFTGVGSEAMVFLDSVRSLRLERPGGKRAIAHHRISEGPAEIIKLPGIEEPCRRVELREPRTNRAWERYEIESQVPSRLQRRHKATGKTMPIAIAIPSEPKKAEQIYAGLPLGVATQLPFSLNAQFDVDVARHRIQHGALNKWLFTRLAGLTAAVALDRVNRNPVGAWRAIPLKAEESVPGSEWLTERFEEMVKFVHRRMRTGFRINIGGEERQLRNLAYEAGTLEGLLDQEAIDGLRPGAMLLPPSARDREGRWRAVLGEINDASFIDVDEALELLDWEDADLGTRNVQWFIKLARAGIEDGHGGTLSLRRSILTADEKRIVPPDPDFESEFLVRSTQKDDLAGRLGLVHEIHPAYLSRWTDAVVVRKWLEEDEMLLDTPNAESTLRALASRDDESEPLSISDGELRLIRDAFVEVDPVLQRKLGLKIGRLISVEVQRLHRKKRVVGPGRPGLAYLPASIDDRTDGWSKAAGKTEGVSWIHPRYEDVLKVAGHLPSGSNQPRPFAAKSFFVLLGAEVAPRLIEPCRIETRYGDPASPIERTKLLPSQRDALSGLGRHATHLQGDRLSPDLGAVLHDLQREGGKRVRRERARALLATLEREWARLFSPYTEATAVWSDHNWHRAGSIPATWLSGAMDTPWLSSEDGKRKSPRELTIRSAVTEAIFGDDRRSFAYELESTDARSPVVLALGIQADPQVSELVEQLATLRKSEGPTDEKAVSLRYAAVSAACTKRNPSPDDMIGDLSVRKLRARFGTRRAKPGLIYAGGRWIPPSKALLGAPIFGGRWAFVSEGSNTQKLWRVLRIAPPSVADCIEVLNELASGPLEAGDEQILVNTYVYLEANLTKASNRDRGRLLDLPLWTGATWETNRPVYVVGDPGVAQALSAHMPIWQLPVGVRSVSGLIAATNTSLLAEEDFDPVIHESAFEAGASIERQFAAAVQLLRDYLTRRDRELFEARSVSWDELAGARVAIDPNLQLELRLDSQARVSVPARAHLSRSPLTFYFTDTGSLGDDEAGGRAIASLFASGDHDKLALAWSRSFARAEKGESGSVSLVEGATGDEGALESLLEQATTTIPRRRKTVRSRKADQPSTKGAGSLPARQLKAIESFVDKTVTVVSGQSASKSRKKGGGGLRDELPLGERIGSVIRTPLAAPLAYSPKEKESLALKVLQVAINGEASELRDFRHLRGVGADALDKLRRYFEIKATYGPIPDEVTMTADEAERALREKDKFFLTVVAGLEEGYETVVKIIPNPFDALQIKPKTSLTLSGIKDQALALEVRFP